MLFFLCTFIIMLELLFPVFQLQVMFTGIYEPSAFDLFNMVFVFLDLVGSM